MFLRNHLRGPSGGSFYLIVDRAPAAVNVDMLDAQYSAFALHNKH